MKTRARPVPGTTIASSIVLLFILACNGQVGGDEAGSNSAAESNEDGDVVVAREDA